MIQQLADRIIREFGILGNTIEINALDGNGGKHCTPKDVQLPYDLSYPLYFCFCTFTDSFHVYYGSVDDLNAYHFAHVLRDPGCFYFFNITCMSAPDAEGDQRIIRRDLCWLTGNILIINYFAGA